MIGDGDNLNTSLNWEHIQQARAASPLSEVLERLRLVVAWEHAPLAWEEYRKRLTDILRRYQDPYLKLAVIGDFSCGKSTFLNAVMGMPLLKTGLMATTAVPTMLRWDGQPGSGVRVIGVCADGRVMDITGEDRTLFSEYVEKELPGDVGDMIDAITTDNRLIERLRQVELSLPTQEGRYGLCLVDTPGVNPGAGDTKAHVTVTRNVLRQSADSAIVLFPANQAFTASFQEFLTENAEHFLNNATFIITKADAAQDDEEVEDLRRYVSKLLEEMGVVSPRVYCVAAQSAFLYDLGQRREEADRRWSLRFHRDIGEIFGMLNRRREAITVESTGSMLAEMIETLQKDLTEMRAELRQRQEALVQWSPQAMRNQCALILRKYVQSIPVKRKYYWSNLSQSLNSVINSERQTIHTRIRSKDRAAELNKYLESELKRDMADLGEVLQSRLNNTLRYQKSDFNDFSDEMIRCLNQFSINISGAATRQYSGVNAADVQYNTAIDGEIAKTATVFSTLVDTLSGVGDVVEDLVSFEILEAVGDLFLAAFTLVEGMFSMFTPIARRQQNAIDTMNSQIERMRTDVLEKSEAMLTEQSQSLEQVANELLERLEKEYGHLFDEKKRQYEAEMAILRSKISDCEHHLDELKACADIVRVEREKGNSDA